MVVNRDLEDAIAAMSKDRHAEALRLISGLLLQITSGAPGSGELYFMTMFELSQLAEQYERARELVARTRDEQVQILLNGDVSLNAVGEPRPRSRFGFIVELNNMLGDSRSTYEVFVQLAIAIPALAGREAFKALPAIVEAGDFALADRYLGDPLGQLAELNRLASAFPLFPPQGEAPRLAAELANFIKDVTLRAAILRGLGRVDEADSLLYEADAGIVSDDMRALASREVAGRGTIFREIAARRMAFDADVG